MTTVTFKRVMAGLYVDCFNQFVISQEARNYYSIRRLVGWGHTLSGESMPDYASIWIADYRTVGEAKQCIIEMLQDRTDYGDAYMEPCDLARRD